MAVTSAPTNRCWQSLPHPRATRAAYLCAAGLVLPKNNAPTLPKGGGGVRPKSAWLWREKSDDVIDVISLDGGPPGHDISRHLWCRPCWALHDESRTPRRGSAQCPYRGMQVVLQCTAQCY
ncbi:hypothetical protein XCCB100_2358 [Xanthomonas campestris pv. campestris]|uniref:Uncharacterized protein n=1 Tax=Xanthomonas campestris pv. campestris (strain B100) TaxID=509169 RepID=B0RTC9_XANCB|nr:hypothetical protein XCCB100_2358 [Xanthomonas campestris pv. campestris]